MPLVLAPLVAVALGALFAFSLGAPERAADLHHARRVVLVFSALSFAPVPGYFAWSAPSWSAAYLWDGERFPSAIALAIVLASAASVVGAFELTERALADGRARVALGAAFAVVAAAILLVALLGDRLWQVGSYAEVAGGFAVPSLTSSATGLAVVGMNGLLGLATWITLLSLRPGREPSRAERRPALRLARAPLGASREPEARGLEPSRRKPRPTSPTRSRR